MASGKPKRVTLTQHYPYPPEVVWKALTDPHALAEWLMPNTFEAREGVKFEFRYDVRPKSRLAGITKCEVLECTPHQRMVWSWVNVVRNKPDHQPTHVSWNLTPEAGGTRLEFTHTGLEHIPRIYRLMMAFGWGTMHKRWIRKVMARVSPDGATFTPGAIPLEKRCYKTRTLPPEFVR